MLLMGLDIGTSGCKCTVCDVQGHIVAASYCEYNALRNGSSHSMDGEMLWASAKKVLFEAAHQCDGKSISALGISTFGESVVPINSNGKPLAPILLYTDKSGTEESLYLAEKLGAQYIMEQSGVNPHAMYSLPKLMYMKKHSPDLFGKAHKFLLIEDYLIYRLSGEAVIDYSLAARTMALDIKKKVWCSELLDVAEIDANKLSRPVPSGTAAGTIKPSLAQELGLSEKLLICTGGHDQACAVVGAGALACGISVDGTGTVECITPVFDKPITNPVMLEGGYACVPHAIDGLYQTYAFSFTGGALLKWFRDNFAKDFSAEAKSKGMSIYSLLDQMVSETPSSLLVLPYFAGAATPRMDERATGAILGLSLETTAPEIYRALMEGVTFEMLLNMELLEKAGISIGEIRTTGGGASSSVWLQIKADILGKPVMSLANCEAGTMGAIMLAGKAAGIYKDIFQASSALLKTGIIYEPNVKFKQQYAEQFEKYKKIYPFTKELYN